MWIVPFGLFHSILCLWNLSMLLHVAVECAMVGIYHNLFSHSTLLSTWVPSSPWLLWIMSLCRVLYMYCDTHVHTLLLNIYLWVKLLNYNICSTFINDISFPKWLNQFAFLPAVCKSSYCFTPTPALCISLHNYRYSGSYVMVTHCSFNMHSPDELYNLVSFCVFNWPFVCPIFVKLLFKFLAHIYTGIKQHDFWVYVF